MLRRLLAPLSALSLVWATPALADDAPAPPPPDKSGFTLFNPTPEADLRSLCTDRPTKSTGPCSVDAGRWQFESDIYNVTIASVDGVTTRTELFTNPTLKLGVTNTLDLEINIAPYEQVTVHDRASGESVTAGGVGDLFLKAKLNLMGDDGGDIGLALAPWVKVPTAPTVIGNGAVEEGLIVPVQFNLPKGAQLLFDPEIDVLANAIGAGRHANAAGLISFSFPAPKTITLSAELWGDANFDPTGTVTQASFDLGAAWIPASLPTFQLDGGVNLGLNRATPGVQTYMGVSKRF
ncbi:MAG: transporter [Caulobacterales bacterium]